MYFTRQINTPEKQAFWTLVVATACALFLYGYFVQMTVRVIIERTVVINETARLKADLGETEAEYNSVRAGITYESAHSLGFAEAENKEFVKRPRVAQNVF